MRKRRKIVLFDAFNYMLFIIIAFISIFPIYLILANAFSSEADIINIGFGVFPLHPTLAAFKMVLREPSQLIYSLFASIVYAFGGTAFAILVQAMLGYTLTRPEFAFKKLCTVLLVFTMFFDAGTIPRYIIYTTVYNLENSWFIYILHGAVSAFNIFLFRTFFNQIPHSLIECAELDGATHMQSLFQIIIPLSWPILVTQFFMNMASRWQDYQVPLYYINDPKMYTLEYYIQVLLKNLVILQDSMLSVGIPREEIPLQSMRFVVVFFTLIPMILIFPILQKKFSKGAMVGSVKG